MPEHSPVLDRSLTTRAAGLRAADTPSTLDEHARTVQFVLATENAARVYDWDHGCVDEVLLMSGVTFPAQVPLLNAHARFSVEDQLGSLRGLRVEGGQLLTTAHFADDPASESAFRKVAGGHLTDISVGYTVQESVWIPESQTATIGDRTFTGPLKVSTRWTVREGSLTPIGADEYAKARSQHQTHEDASMPTPAPVTPDTDDVQRSTPAAPVTPPDTAAPQPEGQNTPAPAAAPAGGSDQTRADCAAIVALGMTHHCMELARAALDNNQSVDQFRAAVLEHLARQSGAHGPTPRVESGLTDGEKFRAAASDALILRTAFAHTLQNPADGALELRGYSLRELARESLRRAGMNAGGDAVTVVGRAFTGGADFPQILADTANKAVEAGAQEANETYQEWTGVSTANDFREQTGVNIDAFTNLEKVRAGGEYTQGQLSERGSVYSVATYGKIFGIDRQAIIDDNLGLLLDAPRFMGRAAMRTVGDMIYAMLTGSYTLADGTALFSSTHGNLASTGGAISGDTFGAGVTAMATHKNAAGGAYNITPAYLITSMANTGTAYGLLNSLVIGTQAQPNVANPWAGKVVPITDARIDLANGKNWFLAAPKGYAINVAYLGGNQTPRVEQRMGWSVDGTEFKVSMDVGAHLVDYRGLYKNAGPAA